MRGCAWIPLLVAVLSAGCIPWFDDDAVDPDVSSACPDVLPDDQGSCSDEGLSCSYGPAVCQCDLPCHPAYGCDCIAGLWRCWHTDPIPCFDVYADVPPTEVFDDVQADVALGCPADPPIGLMASCEANLTCEYGVECCCGSCHPSTICWCWETSGRGYATDACMIQGCPDVFQDVSPWETYDVTPWEAYDTPLEPSSDVSWPDVNEIWTIDVPVPPCCTKNADCGPGWACGSGQGGHGTCKPALPYGECWSLQDCPTGFTCQGARVCPCNADCLDPDQSGTCVSLPVGCCWTDTECGGGKVCRAQGVGDGLPGSCVDDPRGPTCIGDSTCCWNDGDCPKGFACGNVSVCGCIALCPMCGACAPDRMGTCG